MIDGTGFSTWKDFARALIKELDDIHEAKEKAERANEKLKKEHDDLEKDYIAFKSKVTTTFVIIGMVIIALVGLVELSVNILGK